MSVSSFNTPSSISSLASGNRSLPCSSLSGVRPCEAYRSAKPSKEGSAEERPVSNESVQRYRTSFTALMMSSMRDYDAQALDLKRLLNAQQDVE